MGYSRKFPPPPPPNGRHRIGHLNITGFPRITVAVSAVIPNLADSRSWGNSRIFKTFNGFCGIPVKIHKILGKFMDFQSCSPSIFYRISNVDNWGWIFSGIAQYNLIIRLSPGFFKTQLSREGLIPEGANSKVREIRSTRTKETS